MASAVVFEVTSNALALSRARFYAMTLKKPLSFAARLLPRRLSYSRLSVWHIVDADVVVSTQVQLIAGVSPLQASMLASYAIHVPLGLKNKISIC